MAMKFNYDKLILTLDEAREKEKFAIAGEYLYIMTATDGNVNIDLILNTLSEDKINLVQSKGIIAPFSQFWISHEAQAGKSVTLIASSLEGFRIIDNTSSISGTVSTQEKAAANELTNVISVGSSSTLIRAAKSTRKDLILFNPSGGNTVYIGGSGVAVATGMPIEPGAGLSLTMDGTAIYGIAAVAQDINVRESW